jgi:hypothetical protein
MLMRSPLARDRRQPPGFIQPCKPIVSLKVPTGPQWIHELKHDGFRIVAHKDGDDVRLWSRNGRNWSVEFAITAAVMALPFARIVLDGEAVAHCPEGLPDFHALLGRSGCATACFYAFDLLHLGVGDLQPLELCERRALLRAQLRKAQPALLYSEHLDGKQGEAMFRHACRLGLRGHRLEACRQPLQIRPVHELDEGQEPGVRAALDGRTGVARRRVTNRSTTRRGAINVALNHLVSVGVIAGFRTNYESRKEPARLRITVRASGDPGDIRAKVLDALADAGEGAEIIVEAA